MVGMSQPSRQYVCPDCGATRQVSSVEARWSNACQCCGPAPQSVPVALPVASPLANGDENATSANSPSGASVENSTPAPLAGGGEAAEPLQDEQEGRLGWIAENAGIILAATTLLAGAGVVLGLAWSGYQFAVTTEPGEEGLSPESLRQVVVPATLVDASRSSVRRNGVKVKIVSAIFDRLWAKSAELEVVRGEENVMAIRFRINNQLETQRLYSGWRAGSGAVLDDSGGGAYEVLSIDQWASVRGASAEVELRAGETVEDIVLFRPLSPVRLEEIQWLRVRLPATVYGGLGDYYFEIPQAMITGPSDDPPPPDWTEGSAPVDDG